MTQEVTMRTALLIITRIILPSIAFTTAMVVCAFAALLVGLPGPLGLIVGFGLATAVAATADHYGL